MTLTFAEQYEVYKSNVTTGMLELFTEELGVTVESLEKLGVGYFPGEGAWVFAERDAKGDITGLLKRYHNGKKFMEHGSKRGLIYAYNSDHAIGDKKYDAGKFYWVQIHRTGLTCPICARSDWCRVSSDYDDPKGPSAVACSRIKQNSARKIPPDGHLHILDKERQQGICCGVIYQTDLPIIIVEGASDVLAAMVLGFVAIGRPSAEGGMAILHEMPLAGHEVWIIGDNDAGAGKKGMQKTALNIKDMTENIQCILPPEGIKDLRQWVQRGLTQESLFEYVGEHGNDNKELDPNVFADDVAFLIAERFMNESHMLNGVSILRNYRGQWMQWNKDHYEELSLALFKGELYKFLEGKQFTKVTASGMDIVPYKPTRSKVNDIIDAMNRWCPIEKDPPVWLDKEEHPHPNNLIIFKNGMLDVTEYMKGNIVLHNPDPRLFTYNVFPYAFDENVWSNLHEDICNQIFNEDAECIRTLAQWFGYNLVPDMTQEKLMIFTGGTRSGKGTILEALHNMLGKNQYSATSFQALANTHGLYSLIGKLAATLGDARTPRKGEANATLQTILQITGGDCVTVNPKYTPIFDAYLACRFTIVMNELPGFSDSAKAFVARSIILNFPNSYIGREDFTLKDRLRKEAREGKLINFALQGLKDLREQGRFTMPESSKLLLQQLTEITAPVTAFVKECCTEDVDVYIAKDQLYEAWAYWCSKTGHKAGNNIYFGRWLRQACPTVVDFRANIDGQRQYMYKGLELQDWVYTVYLGRPKQ